MEGRAQELELIARAVQHACRAGACRAMAREVPDASAGLLKAARRHGEYATGILEWVGRRQLDAGDGLHPSRDRGANSRDE